MAIRIQAPRRGVALLCGALCTLVICVPASSWAAEPESSPTASAVPHEVVAAYQKFNQAKTLHAKLKRRERGSEDDVEIWIERGVRTSYRDPYLELSDRGKEVVRYYPARNQVFKVEFDVDGRTSLDWLPPLANVHFTFPSGAFGAYDEVVAGQSKGRPALIAKGIKLANEGKMDLYFAKGSGEVLGWIERYPDGFERSFDVAEWSWDATLEWPELEAPADATAVDGEVMLYLEPGRLFPPVTLADAQANKTFVDDLMKRANGAIITIGSPGCGPCVLMKRWLHEHRDELSEAGVITIAIGLMDENEFAAEAELHQSPPVLLRASEPSARAEMKVGGMPTNYLLDARGRVIAGFQGFDPKRMSSCVAEIIDK